MNNIVMVSVLFAIILSPCSAQAPGDGDDQCTSAANTPTYPETEKTLMDSYHYLQLLPGNGTGNIVPGAVWNDMSLDGNDETNSINSTYWQQGTGGICHFQVQVCGWRKYGAKQDNWLFTQHINKSFNHTQYNYPVQIRVDISYGLQNCRSRLGCDMGFRLLNYNTNEIQLPSTTGSGFMNTGNYEQFGRARPNITTWAYTETYSFTLDPSDTGFYIAIQDIGTCIGISRLRVYRYNCKSRKEGLVLYPEAPAPVSGSANININCVDNAVIFGSPQVTCRSNGMWGPENPECKCRPGYEARSSECSATTSSRTASIITSTTESTRIQRDVCPTITITTTSTTITTFTISHIVTTTSTRIILTTFTRTATASTSTILVSTTSTHLLTTTSTIVSTFLIINTYTRTSTAITTSTAVTTSTTTSTQTATASTSTILLSTTSTHLLTSTSIIFSTFAITSIYTRTSTEVTTSTQTANAFTSTITSTEVTTSTTIATTCTATSTHNDIAPSITTSTHNTTSTSTSVIQTTATSTSCLSPSPIIRSDQQQPTSLPKCSRPALIGVSTVSFLMFVTVAIIIMTQCLLMVRMRKSKGVVWRKKTNAEVINTTCDIQVTPNKAHALHKMTSTNEEDMNL